jgi:hypothetical protein
LKYPTSKNYLKKGDYALSGLWIGFMITGLHPVLKSDVLSGLNVKISVY